MPNESSLRRIKWCIPYDYFHYIKIAHVNALVYPNWVNKEKVGRTNILKLIIFTSAIFCTRLNNVYYPL